MRSTLAFAMATLFALGGCHAWTRTACDGIGERRSAITAPEYRSCAAALMAALDEVRPPVRQFVRGDASVRPKALQAWQRLDLLVARSGFPRDVTSFSGRSIERWPDSDMRGFNSAVLQAAFAYHTALEVGENLPASYNEEYFDKASGFHDDAEAMYSDLW